MKNYAVYHSQKGKGAAGGLGNHIDRVKGMEHTYPLADPNRKKLNISVPTKYSKLSLSQAIDERIKVGYKSNRKIRKDSVKFIAHILSGSHNRMKEIFKSDELKLKWITKNAEFLKAEFGSDNIVRFEIHLDEKTPHIHAITIPFTEDGRLSAKEVMGNRQAMVSRQNRYADMMQEFGLERGKKNTKIKHEDVSDYYKRIEQGKEIAKNKAKIFDSKEFKDLNIYKQANTLKNALNSLILAKTDQNLSVQYKEMSKGRLNKL